MGSGAGGKVGVREIAQKMEQTGWWCQDAGESVDSGEADLGAA